MVQHIVFGSLFTLKAVEQSTGLMAAKTSMVAPPGPPEDLKSKSSGESKSLGDISYKSRSGDSAEGPENGSQKS